MNTSNRRGLDLLRQPRGKIPARFHRARISGPRAIEILRATRHLGRAFWKRCIAYHLRSRIEAKMRGLKASGECIAARPDRQIHIRIAVMNHNSAPGTAEIVHMA